MIDMLQDFHTKACSAKALKPFLNFDLITVANVLAPRVQMRSMQGSADKDLYSIQRWPILGNVDVQYTTE